MRKYPQSGSRQRSGSAPESFEPLVSLSPREKQTLALILVANQDKEIAAALGVSESTARGKVQQLLRGLHLQNRSQLIAWAAQRPEVFEQEWVPLALHPMGCGCRSIYCLLAAKGLGLVEQTLADPPAVNELRPVV